MNVQFNSFIHTAAVANNTDKLQPFKTATKISLVGQKKTISAGLICLNKGEGYTWEVSVSCCLWDHSVVFYLL